MYLTIILLGIALSMDAFAVSISGGLTCRKVTVAETLKAALTFGSFQAVMPFLGYITGSLFKKYIDGFDHYIIAALLLYLGIRMIREKAGELNDPAKNNFFRMSNLLLLGVATSLDALIAGLGLSMASIPILPAMAVIGTTTFIFSAAGVRLGCRIGCRLKKAAGLLGGSILIFLALKTLLEGLEVF
jgi:putative Mn2+ efflux pump MntP